MKVGINDEYGTEVFSVSTLNGCEAVEGQDFAIWQGEYHKNGKWSFTEGGVALKDGVIVYLQRSTHSSSDNVVRVKVVYQNNIVLEDRIGKLSEMAEMPDFSPYGEWSDAIKGAFWVYFAKRSERLQTSCLERWEGIAKFI